MELDGAKKCFIFIKDKGFKISTFVSDRHLRLGKWFRETQSCKHLIDIWHVSKSLTKKLERMWNNRGVDNWDLKSSVLVRFVNNSRVW